MFDYYYYQFFLQKLCSVSNRTIKVALLLLLVVTCLTLIVIFAMKITFVKTK